MNEFAVRYLILSSDDNEHIKGYKAFSEVELGEHDNMGYSTIWALLIPNGIGVRFDNNFYKSLSLTFKAIDKGKEVDLPMKYIDNNLFSVTTNYGEFYFYIKHDPKKEYIGCFNQGRVKMAIVEPLDLIKLEEACLEHQFFFVGED